MKVHFLKQNRYIVKIKAFIGLVLFSAFSAYASSCEIVEVRKIKGLYKDRFKQELAVTTLDECIDEGKALLGRENTQKYVYRVSSGKSRRSKRRVLPNAQLKTVKVILRYKGHETAGQTVVAKFRLDP
ncbi:MAG: hypothetical protein ACOVP4_01390 [Bacteriovoracaceae bacterium]